MRVIDTGLYFDSDQVSGRQTENPGVTISWFAIEVDDVSSEFFFEYLISSDPDEALIRTFLDVCVTGRPWSDDGRLFNIRERDRNRGIVDYIFAADVIVERSPPHAIPFEKLLKGSSSVCIGTFIGIGIAAGNYPLMLLTVPAGIVIVGSAIGVARGMENGLNKRIESALKSKRRR